MAFDASGLPKRYSIRLEGFDYSASGAYFLTCCTLARQQLFGRIEDGRMYMNSWGKVVESEWLISASRRSYVELGEFVVMPNHFHAILLINKGNIDSNMAQASRLVSEDSLSSIVRAFKSASTRQINTLRGTPSAKVWQRNFYEHIIRDSAAFDRISDYILNNPFRWKEDRFFVP